MEQDNQFFDLLFDRSPSASTCLLLLEKFEKEGQLTKAIKLGTRALQLFPDDIHLMKFMAQAYQKAGFLGLAEQMLCAIASKLEELASTYKFIAEIYSEQHRNQEALMALEKYLALCPGDKDAEQLKKDLIGQEISVEPREEGILEQIPEPQPEEEHLPVDEELLQPDEGGPAVEIPPAPETAPQEEQAEQPAAVTELATPTLAEIYFNQGQIQDAIQIYEQYLSSHPEDHSASRRLAEIKAISEADQIQEEQGPDIITAKRERTIAILESWLSKIQEMNRV